MHGAGGSLQGAPGPGRRETKPATGLAAAAVIVGLDGSGTSWDAFWWACGEARRLGGRLLAVFVSSSADACMAAMASAAVGVAVSDYAAVDAAATAQAQWLRAEVRRHSDTDDLDITFVHAHGDPARELLRIAAEAGADLIVVGRSEKARHQLAGSIGRHLVIKRGAPVVAVVP
jgi:nucleotide-binding universal stress UspA family protein